MVNNHVYIGGHNYALNTWTLTYIGRNVGIGLESPQNCLTLKIHYRDENTGFMLDVDDVGTYNIKFFSYVVGNGLVGHKFKLNNQDTIHDNILCFAPDGNMGIGNSQGNLHIISANPQLLLESIRQGGGVNNFGNSGHRVGRNAGIANFTGGNDVVLWTAGDGHCGLPTAVEV